MSGVNSVVSIDPIDRNRFVSKIPGTDTVNIRTKQRPPTRISYRQERHSTCYALYVECIIKLIRDFNISDEEDPAELNGVISFLDRIIKLIEMQTTLMYGSSENCNEVIEISNMKQILHSLSKAYREEYLELKTFIDLAESRKDLKGEYEYEFRAAMPELVGEIGESKKYYSIMALAELADAYLMVQNRMEGVTYFEDETLGIYRRGRDPEYQQVSNTTADYVKEEHINEGEILEGLRNGKYQDDIESMASAVLSLLDYNRVGSYKPRTHTTSVGRITKVPPRLSGNASDYTVQPDERSDSVNLFVINIVRHMVLIYVTYNDVITKKFTWDAFVEKCLNLKLTEWDFTNTNSDLWNDVFFDDKDICDYFRFHEYIFLKISDYIREYTFNFQASLQQDIESLVKVKKNDSYASVVFNFFGRSETDSQQPKRTEFSINPTYGIVVSSSKNRPYTQLSHNKQGRHIVAYVLLVEMLRSFCIKYRDELFELQNLSYVMNHVNMIRAFDRNLAQMFNITDESSDNRVDYLPIGINDLKVSTKQKLLLLEGFARLVGFESDKIEKINKRIKTRYVSEMYCIICELFLKDYNIRKYTSITTGRAEIDGKENKVLTSIEYIRQVIDGSIEICITRFAESVLGLFDCDKQSLENDKIEQPFRIAVYKLIELLYYIRSLCFDCQAVIYNLEDILGECIDKFISEWGHNDFPIVIGGEQFYMFAELKRFIVQIVSTSAGVDEVFLENNFRSLSIDTLRRSSSRTHSL